MKLKTKREKIRSLTGFLLFIALTFNAVFVFGSSFFVSDWLNFNSAQALEINKNDFKNFTYAMDSLDIFRRINLSSYLDKPVKIPLRNGKEEDLLVIHPPKILNKTTSLPLRTTLFSAGNIPNEENLRFAKDIEGQINAIAENNQTLLEILRNLTESSLQVSVKNDDELIKLLIQKVQAEESSGTETLDTNPLLTEDSVTSLTGEALSGDGASSSQTRQLLVILLLLLYMNQALASSLNEEKTVCIESGGEWIGGKCFNENAEKCEENGGQWKLFKNACYVEKQICGNSNRDCSNYNGDPASSIWSGSTSNLNSNDNNSQSIYGCACNSAKCLDEETLTCVPKENTKENLCEKSGGEWREFSSAEELCLMHCGETNDNCSGATFNDNYNWESSDGSTEARENCDCGKDKCLSPSGKCIKKTETDADDDKDGVSNKFDKCANTPQGETVNNIENDQNRGCSCNQLATMGKVPKVYCPPDGCEGNYLVRYDRTAMNQPQCQNGVIQQQNNNYGGLNNYNNYNNYGSYGGYDPYGSGYGNSGSGSCPVVSRMPDSRCNNNNNQNDNNNNKKLEDLLKDLLKNKNQNQNKNQGGDKGGGGGGGGGNPSGDPSGNPKPDPNANTNSTAKKTPSGNDPEGVGQFNKERAGTDKDPFLLHATQFTKLCGENTYVLTNAKPREGKLRDKPEPKQEAKPASGAPTKPNTTCPVGGCSMSQDDAKNRIEINKLIQAEDWSKISQSSRDKIEAITSKLDKSGASSNSKMVEMIKGLIQEGKNELTQASNAGAQNPNEYEGMQDPKLAGTPYFKVPTCQELASAHCCVCSACNKKCCDDAKCKNSEQDCKTNCKEPACCGWAVGKDCVKEGKGECKGDKCASSCPNLTGPCKEDAGKSIKLEFDKADPFKAWNISNNKEYTSQKKCEDFNKDAKNKTHEGVCRYDCEGKPVGCEGGYEDCKIIVISNGDEVEHNTTADPTKFDRGLPSGGMTTFTNRKEGTIIKVNGNNMVGPPATKMGWVKELEDEKGKACNCQNSPTGNKPQM